MRIGIDIGGVIIEAVNGGDTTFFSDNYLKTPEVRDAFTTIRELVELGHEVYVISKAGPRTVERTLRWLSSRGFYSYTTLPKERVVFTRTRPQKVPIALMLELDLMVDDNLDTCARMETEGIKAYTELSTLRRVLVHN